MATELKQRTGVPLRDAAEALNISIDAARMRIKRGSLEAYKEDGQWRVILPEPPEQTGEQGEQESEQSTERVHEQGEQPDQTPQALIEQLQSEVAFLCEELTSRRDAERELRVLLARLGDQVKSLPAQPEQAPVTTRRRGFLFRRSDTLAESVAGELVAGLLLFLVLFIITSIPTLFVTAWYWSEQVLSKHNVARAASIALLITLLLDIMITGISMRSLVGELTPIEAERRRKREDAA